VDVLLACRSVLVDGPAGPIPVRADSFQSRYLDMNLKNSSIAQSVSSIVDLSADYDCRLRPLIPVARHWRPLLQHPMAQCCVYE
jgi:hypothetical protein